MNVEPFTVAIPQVELDDLNRRLENTRWPQEPTEKGWMNGTGLVYMKQLVHHWRTEFDWRQVERRIHEFPNYLVEIDNLRLHFLHLHGRGQRTIPLILCHGWPGSFVEMLDLAEMLADPVSYGGDPQDSFDVVVPSLPGFGFSSPPTGDWDRFRIADLWVKLMCGLGYARFGAHAYDIAASTMAVAALRHPSNFIGYHTSEPGNPAPYLGDGSKPLSAKERAYSDFVDEWLLEEGAYMSMCATRPQTLAYGLHDSPAGLAAWIVEKWHAWTEPEVELDTRFSKNALLANIALYWLSGSGNSANNYYRMSKRVPWKPEPHHRITVPTGVVLTATQPIEQVPREYAERMLANIQRWEQLPRGGHFITMEEPALLASHIREFFRPLR